MSVSTDESSYQYIDYIALFLAMAQHAHPQVVLTQCIMSYRLTGPDLQVQVQA